MARAHMAAHVRSQAILDPDSSNANSPQGVWTALDLRLYSAGAQSHPTPYNTISFEELSHIGEGVCLAR